MTAYWTQFLSLVTRRRCDFKRPSDRFINRRPFKSVPLTVAKRDGAQIERMKQNQKKLNSTQSTTLRLTTVSTYHTISIQIRLKPRTQIELVERNGNMVGVVSLFDCRCHFRKVRTNASTSREMVSEMQNAFFMTTMQSFKISLHDWEAFENEAA